MFLLQAGAVSNVKFGDKEGSLPPRGFGEDYHRELFGDPVSERPKETRVTSALIFSHF